jgi:hypothetical protein
VSSQAVPTDRYGAPAPWRRVALVAVVAVLVLAFGGWLVWTTVDHATPDVTSELVGFDAVDEHSTTAEVRVDFGGDDVVASCLVRALAEDHSVVGELSFEARPADGTTYDVTIRTERLATAVEKVGCTTPDQSRPR